LYDRKHLVVSFVLLALGAGGCSRSHGEGFEGEASPRSACAEPARGSRFSVCGSLVVDGNAATSPKGASLNATVGATHSVVSSQNGQFELGGGFHALR
jgi:hypothetical protein